MWLVNCLKSLVSEHHATVNMLNSLKNCITGIPSYCFITLIKIELENVRLSLSEMLGVFVNRLSANDKCFLRIRNNLSQPIHASRN